jgi:hypothetical protein
VVCLGLIVPRGEWDLALVGAEIDGELIEFSKLEFEIAGAKGAFRQPELPNGRSAARRRRRHSGMAEDDM